MNARNVCPLLFLLGFTLGCGESEEVAKRAIELKHRAFLDALVADDLEAVMAIYEEGAVIRMIPFSEHEGADDIREFWKVALDDGDFEGVVFEDVGEKVLEVARDPESGTQGRVSGTVRVNQANGGTYEIQINDTFMGIDGEWKIVRMVWRFRV